MPSMLAGLLSPFPFKNKLLAPAVNSLEIGRFRRKMTKKTLKWSMVLFSLLIGHCAVEKKAYGSCLERALGFTSQWTLSRARNGMTTFVSLDELNVLFYCWGTETKAWKARHKDAEGCWGGEESGSVFELSRINCQLSHTVNLFVFKKWKWQTLT